ncbi:MAG TPA: DUF4232 domain-containing protein [Nitrolancea sp.]|jgi:hypothetical protein|nr:DUF4232 domain-containing protein [Nitrolancea sp.]
MHQHSSIRRAAMRALVVVLAAFLLIPVFANAAPANLPSRVYFPETGHYLANGFLDYWRLNGGLMMFGYPITEEFSQNGLTVQYFQRAVFEYHPDAPAGYTVQLRRLGAIETASNSNPAFAPTTGSSNASCTFYQQTGHGVCFGFRDYWQDHGGLSMFGYPISNEFTENGFTVQYFERARFEYHPGNPPQYQVLLGLLGNTAAQQDGVNTTALPASNGVPNYDPGLMAGTCQPWQLSLTPGAGNAATGHREYIYTFQNVSQVPCTLYGYPGMQMYDATGAPLPTTVIRGGAFEFRDVTPQTVMMAPGAQSSFAIGFTVIPSGSETQSSCPESSRLLVTPPNDYSQLGLAASLDPCGGMINVSPVVAGVPSVDAINTY